MKIRIRFNEEGALRNQRYAFTDRFTLVSELLQNARRAGAQHITVDHDAAARTLTVRDDGRGIDDFQTLLSFHESGWDSRLADRERPFGVGFTKCLYAAARVVVASGRQRLDLDTAAALRREEIEVEAAQEAQDGTLVELHGVDIAGLEHRIEGLCQGFPIDVAFNGRRLERRYAEDRIDMVQTPVGAVHVAGHLDGKDTQDTLVFLQGFCVRYPLNVLDRNRVNVVHLDPKEFIARLPDRDTLIDADQQFQRIETQLTQSWRHLLEAAKTQLPPRQFVDTYYRAMRNWGHLDLLNAMDELPGKLFWRIVDYPVQSAACHQRHVERLATPPSRTEIEQGAVELVSLGSVHEDNAAHWMLAKQRGWLLFADHTVDTEHWIQPFVRRIEEHAAEVRVLDEQARVGFDGRWVSPLVLLCRAVRIRIDDVEADVTDGGVCHDGVIMVPAGETSGEPVRQLCSFIDSNERYLEADMEADRDALASLIRHLRATDAKTLMDALLSELQLGRYPALHGHRFALAVGVGAMPGCSVELLGTAQDGGGHAER